MGAQIHHHGARLLLPRAQKRAWRTALDSARGVRVGEQDVIIFPRYMLRGSIQPALVVLVGCYALTTAGRALWAMRITDRGTRGWRRQWVRLFGTDLATMRRLK